ncbi:MAG: hypothetical protein IKM49_05860 [Ruminococcus sp.]|nr:hypothetical protein [Ruminococcus sp.]
MYTDKYSSKPLFPYASGFYMILPRGIEKSRKVGEGSIVIENDYVIYFKPETPEDIKLRLVKDYVEYHRKKKEEQQILGYIS